MSRKYMSRADELAAVWGAARGVRDCGRLAADWLTGVHQVFPDYLDSAPAAESTPILELLVAINRAGFFTTCSQPGSPVQRAFVSGLIPCDAADVWLDGLRERGLIVLFADPDEGGFTDIGVTRRPGGGIKTWAGRFAPVDVTLDELPDVVLESLHHDSFQVDVIDDWDEGDRLFREVLAVITGEMA